jgi:hypothetical protein
MMRDSNGFSHNYECIVFFGQTRCTCRYRSILTGAVALLVFALQVYEKTMVTFKEYIVTLALFYLIQKVRHFSPGKPYTSSPL